MCTSPDNVMTSDRFILFQPDACPTAKCLSRYRFYLSSSVKRVSESLGGSNQAIGIAQSTAKQYTFAKHIGMQPLA
jgi:hypothetical protein